MVPPVVPDSDPVPVEVPEVAPPGVGDGLNFLPCFMPPEDVPVVPDSVPVVPELVPEVSPEVMSEGVPEVVDPEVVPEEEVPASDPVLVPVLDPPPLALAVVRKPKVASVTMRKRKLNI